MNNVSNASPDVMDATFFTPPQSPLGSPALSAHPSPPQDTDECALRCRSPFNLPGNLLDFPASPQSENHWQEIVPSHVLIARPAGTQTKVPHELEVLTTSELPFLLQHHSPDITSPCSGSNAMTDLPFVPRPSSGPSVSFTPPQFSEYAPHIVAGVTSPVPLSLPSRMLAIGNEALLTYNALHSIFTDEVRPIIIHRSI